MILDDTGIRRYELLRGQLKFNTDPVNQYAIGGYKVDKNGTLTGAANEPLIAALQAKSFMAE